MRMRLYLVLFAASAAVVALVAVAAPSIAGAGSRDRARPAGHTIRLKEGLFQYAVTGSPPANGTNSYVGTNDGTIGAIHVHGTVRGTNTYGHGVVAGRNTIFGAAGSIRISFLASVGAGGVVSGAGKFTGGTGKYKGAHGRFTITAVRISPTGSSYFRELKGTIVYP